MEKIDDNELIAFIAELNKKAAKYVDAAKVVYSSEDKETLNEAINTNNELYSAAKMFRMLDRIFKCADEEEEPEA